MPGQQDVMIVGEPILMGGELGDEDERRITRLENNNNTDYMSPPPPSHQPSLSQPPQQQAVSAVSAHHTTQQLNHTDMSIQSTVSNTATTDAVALINGDTDGNGMWKILDYKSMSYVLCDGLMGLISKNLNNHGKLL